MIQFLECPNIRQQITRLLFDLETEKLALR